MEKTKIEHGEIEPLINFFQAISFQKDNRFVKLRIGIPLVFARNNQKALN